VLSPSPRLRRRGTSLVELVVALSLTGLVLATAGSSLLRQQRGFRWIGDVTGVESQMRPLAQTLSAELALLDPTVGDIAPGQASDSTLQLRATVASSLACDSATSAVTLVPESATGVATSGSARAAAVGDSLWFLSDSLGWQARRITAVSRVTTGCRSPAASNAATIRLTLDAPIDAPAATPIRVTRQERYLVYRASDGAWYFGVSDWSVATGRFASPQPIAGPFLRSTSDGARTGFRYFEASGATITPDGSNERTIARIRVCSASRIGVAGAPGGTSGGAATGSVVVRRDSADAALARSAAP
jgi:hypothetical protein